MNLLRMVLVIAMVVFLGACASSHVLVGTPREPLDSWEDVKVYLEPPAKYETIALLEASDQGANQFSAQSKMRKVISRLQAEAADLGANGILLQGVETYQSGSIGSGYAQTTATGNTAYTTGMGYSAAQLGKLGRALAIYVEEE